MMNNVSKIMNNTYPMLIAMGALLLGSINSVQGNNGFEPLKLRPPDSYTQSQRSLGAAGSFCKDNRKTWLLSRYSCTADTNTWLSVDNKKSSANPSTSLADSVVDQVNHKNSL